MYSIPLDEVVHFDAVTHNPSTGAVSDADSTPTFSVFEEDTDTPIVGPTNLTKRTSLTGHYRGVTTASTANGYEVGKVYSIVASATVGSVAGKTVVASFRVVPAESVAGTPKVDVSHAAGTAWGSGAITVASFAAALITAIRDKIFERTTFSGTIGTGSTATSIVTSAISPATSVADQLKGQILMFNHDTTTAALRGQKAEITASSASATPTLTVATAALTTAPVSGDTFTIG